MRGFKQSLEKDMALETWLAEQIRLELKILPEGRLTPGGKGETVYYIRGKEKARGISPDKPLAQGVAQRVLLEKQLAIIEANLKVQQKAEKVYQSYTYESVLQQIGEVYQTIELLAQNRIEREGTAGKAAVSFHDETLKHVMPDAQLRRSKSEVILSMIYDGYRIPYNYEERVYWPENVPPKAWEMKRQLKLRDFYVPDFTFTFPDGRKKYHEHLGMMDNLGYMEDWKKKMVFYYWAGITPGDNLIITADDCHGRINQKEIASIIEGQLGELIGMAKLRRDFK